MRQPKFVQLIQQAVANAAADKVSYMGAAIAFYSMISIAPLFVVSIGVAGFVFGPEAAEGEVYGQLHGLIGAEGAAVVEEMIQRSRDPGAGLLASLLGVGLLLVGASWLFGALQTSFDRIWNIEPRPERSWLATLKDYFLSVLMVAGTGFLLLISLLVSATVSILTNVFGEAVPAAQTLILYLLNLVGGFLIVTLVFGAILKALSNVTLAWRDVLVGALFTSLLFSVGRFLIGEYLGRGSFATVYGAAGSLAVLLLWVYYSAQILCLGAEFTKAYANARGAQPRPRKGLRFIPDGDACPTAPL